MNKPYRGEGKRSEVRVSNVYEPPSAEDGTRVLVDPAWPRDVPKTAARVAEWFPTVAPSSALRGRFGRDPANFAELRRQYLNELREPLRALAMACLEQVARRGPVILLTADEDTEHSPAAVLAERLQAADHGAQASAVPAFRP
jgi:uncharacterized protein YeaO (DUF488 family)